ncbi:MAG: hypothetical protein KF768_07555 [Phycisphaeraceae bacterium]|nr:hypothetical protein [Phycisphaeraceae bacterium]
MTQTFTILVEGRDGGVPAERFVDVIHKVLAVLRELDSKSSGDGKPSIHWNITRATSNSPLTLTLEANVPARRRDTSRTVFKSYMRGMRKLESGKGVPSDFDDDTLREARALLGLLDRGVARMEFAGPGEEAVSPTLRSAALIDEFMGRRAAYHLSETAIEGSLETVTIHGGEAFDVFDQLTGTRVRCILPDGQIGEAVSALGKRVAVSGRAKFSDKGRPISIEVEEIRVLRDKSELPAASDFEGDGKLDITGGMDSADFVRRIRDA